MKEIFSRFGEIDTLLLQEDNTIGVVKFSSILHAKNSFESLQGFLVNKVPLMLEWAPINLLENFVKNYEIEKN